jgi:hypothetical protein
MPTDGITIPAIAENLERLEWFGILISREEGGVTRWQLLEMQQAA